MKKNVSFRTVPLVWYLM